jgi:protein-tyrosine phosphatase
VINCAADHSADYFKDQGLEYKSYHLKDNVRENIECVFYDAIDFFEQVKSQKGRVYVHCVQGISRSCTIIIAYLIKTKAIRWEDGFDFMRSKRPIVNPNMSFIA